MRLNSNVMNLQYQEWSTSSTGNYVPKTDNYSLQGGHGTALHQFSYLMVDKYQCRYIHTS